MKTKLKLRISGQGIQLAVYNVEQQQLKFRFESLNYTHDFIVSDNEQQIADTIAEYKVKTENIANIPLNVRFSNCDLSQDFTASWLYHTIPSMLYNLLKCMYRKANSESQERILNKYMIETVRFIKDYGTNANFDFVVNPDILPTTKVKIHSKTMVKFSDGSKHMVERIPTFDVEYTDIGYELSLANDNTDYQSDVFDIIQTGIEFALKLLDLGIVNSFSDLWDYQSGIQSAMRKYIYSNKKFTDNTELSDLMTVFNDTDSDNPADVIFKGTRIKSALNKFELSELQKAVIDTLSNMLCKRKANVKETMIKAFIMYYFNERSISYIANDINVSEKTLYRYLLNVKAEIQDNVSLNNALHKMVSERLMND